MNKTIIIAIIIGFSTSLFAGNPKQIPSSDPVRENRSADRQAQGNTREVIMARAYLDAEKRIPVYTERHTAFFQNGKLQTSENDYFDLNGKKIAELNSDYTRSLMMPTYVFRDFRTGSVEGLRWENGEYRIFRQAKGKPEEVKPLDNVENVFSCQGWHYFLIANLNQLKQSPIKMKLIFPSRLDYYSFRIRPIDTTAEILKLRLEFDSWIIRLFTPHLDITYDRAKKKIVEYYGPSNIRNNQGEIQNVYIVYD